MIADLREAIGDMPIAAVITHPGGGRTTLAACAVSDLQGADRMIDEEGIMIEADIALTYAAPDVKLPVTTACNVRVRGKLYTIARIRRDRSNGVAVVLECKEAR